MLRGFHGPTKTVIFRTPPRRVRFGGAPEENLGFVFRLCNCFFPTAGLYWIEVVFAGSVIARQKLWVRR